MSEKWYPVIDYQKCTECGLCIEKCSHGVYDLGKAPVPIVISPEKCIEGCQGCKDLCPSEAISYVGENLYKTNGCGCSCSGDGGGCCG